MTWTYNLAQLQTDPKTQVRYLIGDTDSADPLLQDEEINFSITQFTNIYYAAAQCCRSIATHFAREADSAQGPISEKLTQKTKAFDAMAARYENDGQFRSGALPYAGGISISDKAAAETDGDRVPPSFGIGMEDNYLPVAPAGNEGSPNVGGFVSS